MAWTWITGSVSAIFLQFDFPQSQLIRFLPQPRSNAGAMEMKNFDFDSREIGGVFRLDRPDQVSRSVGNFEGS
jgi:hypothetical protein